MTVSLPDKLRTKPTRTHDLTPIQQDPAENWFESWFDTPLYEQLYAGRDMAEAEKLAELISQHAPADSYPNVLDAGCGRGRHSINLARLGYDVTGVDLSENAIKKARKLSENLPFAHRLRFRIHDLRKPVGRQFNLVVNLFTSFGYLQDDGVNLGILANMCESTSPGGMLVIDYLNAPFVEKNLVPEEQREIEGYTVDITRKIENGMVVKQMRFTGEDQESQLYSEKVKLYGRDWFEDALKRNGMQIEFACGDYEGAAHHPERSPRLVLFARRLGLG